MYAVGIDIGSTSAKTIVLDQEKKIIFQDIQPTGWSSVDTAEAVWKKLTEAGIDMDQAKTVSTGYGRGAVPYADKQVTEITCHALGACQIFKELTDMTVIDIGGQDTKIIKIRGRMVEEFIMNDKCSAGTGRFLEVMANTLGVKPGELFSLATRGEAVEISSMCTVFAESEVISLIGKGEKKENIAYGIVDSIVRKVATQAARLVEPVIPVCLTGGLCEADYILQSLGRELKQEIHTDQLCRYAGALE
jgi:(R)-2-hydroxyacyl-CoA dehydratese activating ATPase